MIAMDIDGGGKRPVSHPHNNGASQTGCNVHDFVHQRQALTASGGKNPGPGEAGSHARGHRRVFGLNANELGFHFTIGHVLAELFHHDRLRRYGIRGYHIHVTLFGGECYRLVTG